MDRKEALLAAARALFREKGYRAASVRAIGEAAGLGPGAVSYYFGGKRALYEAAFPGENPEAQGVKARIEEAALALFAEAGYERVTIRDVASAAGVNSAAISYYFGGKEELYRALLRRAAALIDEFEAIIERDRPAPAEVLHLFGTFLRRFGEEQPAVLRLIAREITGGSAVFREFVEEHLAGLIACVRRAVAAGVADGSFRREAKPEEACIAWGGMVFFYFLSAGLHQAVSPERTLTPGGYLDEAWRIFTRGILRGEEDGQ